MTLPNSSRPPDAPVGLVEGQPHPLPGIATIDTFGAGEHVLVLLRYFDRRDTRDTRGGPKLRPIDPITRLGA